MFIKVLVILVLGLVGLALYAAGIGAHREAEVTRIGVSCADGEPPLVTAVSEEDDQIDCRPGRYTAKSRNTKL